MGSNNAAWYEGLVQAARLLSSQRMVLHFGADKIRDTFNDRMHFDRSQRQNLLGLVLKNAPRTVVQDVLRRIDGDDVDVSERDDEEIILVRELIRTLGEDVRCCRHAYFKMKSDWIASRWGGVLVHEELTPEQICDHIEDEDNYEELLRLAVNRCMKYGRKFEAARMLARPPSRVTRVFETNRNDKQLAYLVSLYQEMEKPLSRFGPIEECCLRLPCSQSDVLYIDDDSSALAKLEHDLLDDPQEKLAIGVWWFWRCFDPGLDVWPRASFLAIAYPGAFVIVDFMRLENHYAVERKSKDIVSRIMAAPNILKVTHDIAAARALEVLQRTLIPHEDLISDEVPAYPTVMPLIDLGMVAAFVRQKKPSASCASKLGSVTFDYLRLELCLSEMLSNFERRPLRQSQLHFALTLAWCPLMILRALCSYEIVTLQQVRLMTLRVGFIGAPRNWEDGLRRVCFSSETHGRQGPYEWDMDGNECSSGLPGQYAKNLWEDSLWHSKLQRPDMKLDLGALLRRHVAALMIPEEGRIGMEGALAFLFNQARTKEELNGLYTAYQQQETTNARTTT